MQENRPHPNTLGMPGALTLANSASLENFVRLQQSQEDFLAWLNANEKLAMVDRYSYRKIR